MDVAEVDIGRSVVNIDNGRRRLRIACDKVHVFVLFIRSGGDRVQDDISGKGLTQRNMRDGDVNISVHLKVVDVKAVDTIDIVLGAVFLFRNDIENDSIV